MCEKCEIIISKNKILIISDKIEVAESLICELVISVLESKNIELKMKEKSAIVNDDYMIERIHESSKNEENFVNINSIKILNETENLDYNEKLIFFENFLTTTFLYIMTLIFNTDEISQIINEIAEDYIDQ